jgi:hypothetical protein
MKKYRTDVKIRIDAACIEWTGKTRERLAEAIAGKLEDMGLTLHQGLDVTLIERTGSMQGKRTTVKLPKFRRVR